MANPSPPENWSLTYETNPQDGDTVSTGDNWMRQMKLDIRKRAEVEHQFGSVTGDDNGLHRLGSARAFVQAAAPTVIEQGDYNNTTGTTGTATLSTNATNSAPAETVGLGRLWFNPIDGSISVYGAAGWVTATNMPRGHLGGLGVSVNGTNNDVTISPGEARTGTSTNRSMRNASLSAIFVKQLDALWALGNNGGGRASEGTIVANTWYHLFIIVSPTGTIDAGLDTSAEAVGLLANAAVIAAGFSVGTTTYRRIASVRTNSLGNLTTFIQHGDLFTWSVPVPLDIDDPSDSANRSGADFQLALAHTPLGVRVEVFFNVWLQLASGTGRFRSGGTTIGASPQSSVSPLGNISINAPRLYRLLTDTSQRIMFRMQDGDTGHDLHIEVEGYVDARGRWD